jgi:sec-independent protein translocase protein TatA
MADGAPTIRRPTNPFMEMSNPLQTLFSDILAVNGRHIMIEGLMQPSHLLIILAVALFVFGPKKLPELGQGLGKGIRSFKESMKAATEEPEKTENTTVKSQQ